MFLEIGEAGPVHPPMNNAEDDSFKYKVASKYGPRQGRKEPEKFDPEEVFFGKKKRRCIRCGEKRASIIRGNN